MEFFGANAVFNGHTFVVGCCSAVLMVKKNMKLILCKKLFLMKYTSVKGFIG